MKLVNMMITILMLLCERKNFYYSKRLEQELIKNNTISFTFSNKNNTNPNIVNNLNIETFSIPNSESGSRSIDSSITNLRKFHSTLEKKIKLFEMQHSKDSNVKNINNLSTPSTHSKLKKKKTHKEKEDENTFMFYNSLSLIMLSMLAGGLVGVVFILYFSFKKEGSDSDK